jgi:hypothetical protein
MQQQSQSQSHVNAINDINEKIKQQQQQQQQQQQPIQCQGQDPIHSHEIRDPYGILHFMELRRSRL